MARIIYTANDIEAAQEHVSRKNRDSHPEGTFDKADRWYPSSSEECSCCDYVRSPSRAWPLSLNKHCRSAEHCANLFNANLTAVRQISNKIEKGISIEAIISEQEEYLAKSAAKAAKAAAKAEKVLAKSTKTLECAA